MRLLLVGCEYSGTTTLAHAIIGWAKETLGAENIGLHDHFKWPHLSHPPATTAEESEALFAAWEEGRGEDPTRMGLTLDEQERILALSPNVKEMFQRYHIDYHLHDAFYQDPDYFTVGMHIEEAVYAPLYFDYGMEGVYGNRKRFAQSVEHRLIQIAPDTVLVLVTASPEVIRRRMREAPHENAVVQEKDIELVLRRFEEESERSSLTHKFVLDTSTATVKETLAEFVQKIKPHLTQTDRLRILTHRALQREG